MDTGKADLEMFFKPYQVEALRTLWSYASDGANSRTVWLAVNENLEDSISRASIINSLNTMVDEGILRFTEATGKGGHHRVYYMDFNETMLKEHLVRIIIDKLLVEQKDETEKVIRDHL
jgi:hypothetical protein